VPSRLQPITVETLLDSALAEERVPDRVSAVAGLAPHLDSGQLDRAWELARELPHERAREILVGDLLPHLDARHLAEAIQLAATRPGLLEVLAPRLTRHRQQELIEGLLAEVEASPQDAGRLAPLRPLLSTEQVSRLGRLLLAGEDPARTVEALRCWVPVLPAGLRSEALTLLRTAHPDDWTLARALENDWIAYLSANEARQLLPMVAGLNPNARAEILPALTAVLPEIAPAALEALRHGHGTSRGIPALAKALSPAARCELLTVLASPPAQGLPPSPGPGLRSVVPLLDDGQLEWVLRFCDGGPYPHTWLGAAALCLPRLRGPLRAQVQDRVVEQMLELRSIRPLPQFIGPLRHEQYDGISEPGHLLAAEDLLRAEQYRALIPFAFTLPLGDAVGVVALAHKLDRDQRDEALRTVERLHLLDDRAILVRALAPFLDNEQIAVAATLPALAEVAPDTNLVQVFTSLAASATDTALHERLTAAATRIAEAMTDTYRSGCALIDLAAVCRTEPDRQRVLHAAVRLLPQLSGSRRDIIRSGAAGLLRALEQDCPAEE
jgi:hypothetical protein